MQIIETKLISIEGNIGAGKTTLLREIKKRYESDPRIVFIDEPVEEWESIKDESGQTMLQKFYSDPKKYGFSLQMLAFISRYNKIKETIKSREGEKCIFITERCLHTDKFVFAKMLAEKGDIEDVNYQIYCKWFDTFANEFTIDKVIYVQASPEVCKSRIEQRSRAGESNIELSYLIKCHEYHEDMMEEMDDNLNIPLLLINADRNVHQSLTRWLAGIHDFIFTTRQEYSEL